MYKQDQNVFIRFNHGLRTLREEKAFTVRPKIHSQSQIFRYGGSIFCLPHRPNFSDIFDLCLHWVSVVRGQYYVISAIFGIFINGDTDYGHPMKAKIKDI